MMTLNARRWRVCLCVLPLLVSCGLQAPRPTVTRTEFVTVPIPAYKPLPVTLTAPLPRPPVPLLSCSDSAGWPAVCVLDALATIPAWDAFADMCNRDRARAALLGTTDGQ